MMTSSGETTSAANSADEGVRRLPLVYLDTNLYGMLAKAPQCWARVRTWLLDSGLHVGFSGANAVELADARGLTHKLASFLISMPSVILKSIDTIIDEEASAYPAERTAADILGPLPTQVQEPDVLDQTVSFLQGLALREARRSQRDLIDKFKEKLAERFDTFPPDASGRYTVNQAWLYAFSIVCQWLMGSHPAILREVYASAEAGKPFDASRIASVWLFGLLHYFRYYLHSRPVLDSDFGDFHHPFHFPYCRIIVVEKALAQELRHLKSEGLALQNTEVHDVSFMRELTGVNLR